MRGLAVLFAMRFRFVQFQAGVVDVKRHGAEPSFWSVYHPIPNPSALFDPRRVSYRKLLSVAVTQAWAWLVPRDDSGQVSPDERRSS